MIIVTGGAGFIGSNLIHGLNRQGMRDILVVDDMKQGEKHLNLNCLDFADYVAHDDLFELLPRLPHVDAVFHQGACSDTTERDGHYMLKNNYEYSKRLLDFAESRGIRFLYASSAATYGDGANGFREAHECEYPLNVYGFSKLTFDNYVRRRLGRSRASIAGLRYFNVYGPQERHKGRMASVAMHLFDQLRSSSRMKLFEGSDEFRRDFIHVDDVVAVNLWLLGSSAEGIYNCGSGEARSFTEIAQRLRSTYGGGELEYVPFPEDLRGKYQRFTEADLTQLRAAGYKRPFLSLEEGVGRYYARLVESDGFIRQRGAADAEE